MPIILVFILSAYWVMWIIVALWLYSVGKPYSDGSSPAPSMSWTTETKEALGFWFFSLLWNNAFITAMWYMILAGSVCIWYFAQGAGVHVPITTLGKSAYRFFRYHIGTAAFGSLILAIVQFLKWILKYIEW